MQIERILVPTDFSDAARQALRYGLSLALQFQAELHVLHVVPDTSTLSYAYPTEGLDLERRHVEAAQRAMDRLIPEEQRKFVRVTAEVRLGDIQEEISAKIERDQIDFVVMGTHGRRRFERWVLGSVAERMLRKVPVPVLTVAHLDAPHAVESFESVPIRRIIYASDLVDTPTRAARYAIGLATAFQAELIVLHVVEKLRWIYDSSLLTGFELNREKIIETARHQLEQVLPADRPAVLRVETLVEEGTPHEGILKAAKDRGADLIVMNMHSKGLAERALLGYTAERVVRSSPVPVLSIPGVEAEPAMLPVLKASTVLI